MKYENGIMKDIKIAYVGGGSRGWAWRLMSDLALAEDISGSVALYDIDIEAAKANVKIGEKFNSLKGTKSKWNYFVEETLENALLGADFVIISILPGTFEEMESDVHSPEKYGIYQSVGDTVGLGGIIRAVRTVPMLEEIGLAVKKVCPNAWVINYTNPMTMCVKALYRVFPEIKAFGCCHEVFSTQNIFVKVIEDYLGIKDIKREDIKINVLGVNHFTFVDKAFYQNIDLMPYYKQMAKEHKEKGFYENLDQNWFNSVFRTTEKVKIDLCNRYGYVAAAGDRHLAEFCPKSWYLENPKVVDEFMFALTPVSFRIKGREDLIKLSKDYASGEKELTLQPSGEEGVNQIRALLGLCDLVTNVNIPNIGQIPNLPIGAVVETNAAFRSNDLRPLIAGNIPKAIYPLIAKISGEQEALDEGIAERDLEKVFNVFLYDNQMNLTFDKARELFNEMIEKTKKYIDKKFFEK